MIAKMIPKLSMIISMNLNLVVIQCEVSPTFSKTMKLNFIRMAAYLTKLPTLQVYQKGSSFIYCDHIVFSRHAFRPKTLS